MTSPSKCYFVSTSNLSKPMIRKHVYIMLQVVVKIYHFLHNRLRSIWMECASVRQVGIRFAEDFGFLWTASNQLACSVILFWLFLRHSHFDN